MIEARAGEDAAPSDPYMAELTSRALVSAALSQAEPSLAAEAEVKLRRLIAGSPYDGSLHLELGTALAAQGHFEQAETEYITASELVPYRSEPFRNLGLLAEQGGDLEAARVYLSQALWIDPRDEVAIRLGSVGCRRVECFPDSGAHESVTIGVTRADPDCGPIAIGPSPRIVVRCHHPSA